MNKQVTFYLVSNNYSKVITKLCEKLYESKEKVLILCEDHDEVKLLDSKLWTFSKLSYLPHGSKFSFPIAEANFANIWLSTNIEFLNNPIYLINKGVNNLSKSIQHFKKIIDILEEDKIELAKNRAIFYKELGFEEQIVWEQNINNHGWIKKEILI